MKRTDGNENEVKEEGGEWKAGQDRKIKEDKRMQMEEERREWQGRAGPGGKEREGGKGAAEGGKEG